MMQREGRHDTRTRAGESEQGSYWLLKGKTGCFYDCARFHDSRYTALCVFDCKQAAEENAASLDENHLFLNTLELYGAYLPECVRQGPMLPEPIGVSPGELWEVIEALSVDYVTINPPSAAEEVKTFKLWPSEAFNVA